MDGRSRNPIVALGDPKQIAEQLQGYDKYRCRSCKSLRLGFRFVRSTNCGKCGSSDIDVETDMTSLRLEVERLADDPVLGPALREEYERRQRERGGP